MRTTFTMELKVDIDDKEEREVINEALRQAAQLLFAQATLISQRRAPVIRVQSENSVDGVQELPLHDEEGG